MKNLVKMFLVILIVFLSSFSTKVYASSQSDDALIAPREKADHKWIEINLTDNLSQFTYSFSAQGAINYSSKESFKIGFYLGDIINFNPNHVFGNNALFVGYEVGIFTSNYSVRLIAETDRGMIRSTVLSLTINI